MICDPSEWRRRDHGELSAELHAELSGARDEEGQARSLQRFRDRAIFRAGFRAILGLAATPEALSDELTDAAEVLLQGAYAVASGELHDTLPRLADGRPAPSALFALGKAGRQGTTFALDFRLRPYGRVGAPATSLSAFADYYRGEGPAWGYERQALVKLRAIAGDPGLIAEVEALRDRFVYGPEPFDLDGCRRLRRLQVEQLVQPGRINAKFSPGALVDIEYFVQALQSPTAGTTRACGPRTPCARSRPWAPRAGSMLARSRLYGPAIASSGP
jgi:glutamate-ammonia-ligase adenylyltransferase